MIVQHNALPCLIDRLKSLTVEPSGAPRRANQPASQKRFRVVNLTRNIVLASSLEVADTAGTRRKGLLGRKALSSDGGLWIVPCESVHTFFMRFAIDIVYLDRNKRVKKLRRAMAPWRISVCLSAHSVLELPPGIISKSRTRCGDRLEFSPQSE